MKKLILTVSASLFIYFTSHAQWDSVGSGVKGQISSASLEVLTQTPYNGNLYIGGAFDTVGGMPASGLGEWNGSNWNVFSKVNIGGVVIASTGYNSNLIIGGTFDSVGGVFARSIALWNGSSWAGFGTGISGGVGVEALTVYNGHLIAAGAFNNAGGANAYNIAEWNGTSWITLGNGVYNETISKFSKAGGAVFALAVYKGNLYAGGKFDSAGTVAASNIAMWNGTSWSAVGGGFNDSTIGALIVFNNELYAGGFVGSYVKSKGVIAKWNGTVWASLGTGYTGKSYNGSKVFAVCVYDSAVYAAGGFDTIDGVAANSVAEWNGVNWAPLTRGIIGKAYVLTVYDSTLYAAGTFNRAGYGIAVNNIAKWCTVCPVGINELKVESEKLKVYPNPSNGVFTVESSTLKAESVVEVYNMLGEKVYSMGNRQWSMLNSSLSTVNSQFVIDLSRQPAGIYLYRICEPNGKLIASGKLILDK